MSNWNQITIMGPTDYSIVSRCYQEIEKQLVDLGNLGIQDLAPGYPEASGGKKIQLMNYENISNYFRIALSNLGIQIISAEHCYGVFYLENANIEKIIKALTYADTFHNEWDANRPILERWFGGSGFTVDTKEAKQLVEGIQKIIVN